MSEIECANCVKLRAEFVAYVERTDSLIKVLTSQLEKAEKRVKDLEEKLGKNSSNSSIPPSANPTGSKKPVVKKPTGRKPVGQPVRPFHPPFRFQPGQLQDISIIIPRPAKSAGARCRRRVAKM